MNETAFSPKRGSLLNAVRECLGRIVDKSANDVRLKGMTKAEWSKRGIGDPMVVPFQTGATEHCYAVELVFCEESHPLAVEILNLYAGSESIEYWADELWRLWSEAEDEEAGY